MKTHFQLLALVLAFLMALPVFALAESQAEPIEVTIAVTRHPNDATQSYAEKHFAIQAEEDTGIHVNWIEITSAEQVTALLAGDLPDAFWGGNISDDVVSQNADLFLPLEDLMAEYAPNVLALYEENFSGWESYLTHPDGHIYGFMGGIYNRPNGMTYAAQWINTRWLENVGMEIPTTAEELYDVLVAFRDQDANGNGDPTDEIPLNFCNAYYCAKITNLASMWGVPCTNADTGDFFTIQDGKVVGTVNTDAYRAFLETMYQWGQEGLINVEGLSQTVDQYTSQISGDRSGLFYDWAPYTSITDADLKSQFQAQPAIAADGYDACIGVVGPINATRYAFVISASSPYATDLVRWWDYLSQDLDMAMFVARGENGLIYEKGEDGIYYDHTPTAEELIALGYDTYVNNIGSSTLTASLGHMNYHPVVINDIAVDLTKDTTSNTAVRSLAIEALKDAFEDEFMSQAMVPVANVDDRDFGTEGLITYINEFTADAIINGVTDESWNQHLAQLETYNYGYYLEWYQDYLDGNF